MWAQAINVALGLWIMAAPAMLDYGRPASTSAHIAGPLAATFACIALWESTRPVRWVNVPIGLWLAVAPWLLDAPQAARINGLIVGMAIAALSFFGGQIKQSFGGGWSMLWRGDAAEQKD